MDKRIKRLANANLFLTVNLVANYGSKTKNLSVAVTGSSYDYDFLISAFEMGNGTDWSAEVTNIVLGPEDGGATPYKIEKGDYNSFYFHEYDSMVHFYGPLKYTGSLSFHELQIDIYYNHNVNITMTDGETDYEAENVRIYLNGTSFENAVISIDADINFDQGIYRGKEFTVSFD